MTQTQTVARPNYKLLIKPQAPANMVKVRRPPFRWVRFTHNMDTRRVQVWRLEKV